MSMRWRRPRLLVPLAIVVVLLGAGLVFRSRLLGLYYLHAAQKACERHRLTEAQNQLAACLQLCPNDSDAQLLAARLARRKGDAEAAEKYLTECDRLGEGATDAFRLERALLDVQQGDLSPQRVKQLRAERERLPWEAPLILEALGRGFLDSSRLGEALAALNESLLLAPDNPQTLFLRGWVHETLTKPRAIDDYRQALQLDPEHDEARQRLGETLLRFGRWDEARTQFEELCRRRPEDPAARLGLARSLGMAGQEPEARRLLDGLLGEHPEFADGLLERGRLALEAGDGAAAEALLRRAIAAGPSDRPASHLLAEALQLQGKWDEARRQQERTEHLMADLARVRKILHEELVQRPNDAALQCELGTLYLRHGQEQPGLRWLRSAVRLEPHNQPAHQALADYYERRGKVTEAGEHRQLAKAARPN